MNDYKSSYDWYLSNGYIYCCGDGTHGDQKTCKNDNDLLYITLNLDEQKIYLSINGEEPFIPSAFKNIEQGKYRLAVAIYYARGTIIELL